MVIKKIMIMRYLILFLIIIFISCNAKKSTVERTTTSDTLIRTSLTYKTAPIQSNYTIDLECDTIIGKVKPINFSEVSGDNSARLKIENNQLKALLKVAETESKTDTIYKTKFKDVFKDKEVIRYKTPLWMWLVIVISLGVIAFLLRKSLIKLFI